MINRKKTVVILDYGMGNLGSVRNMLTKVGVNVLITAENSMLCAGDALILPGVGSFDHAMSNLCRLRLDDSLRKIVDNGSMPVLGICLGMQIMCKSSEEGSLEGFGFFDAEVKKFAFPVGHGLKVPHMGWSRVKSVKDGTPLDMDDKVVPRYYFVHSFHVKCRYEADVIGRTNYGLEFDSAIRKGNLMGVQFHPEKSHRFGIEFFERYKNSI